MATLLHSLWQYLDREDANTELKGVRVFLRHPHKGIKYSQGEMRWGILIQFILCLHMLFLLIVRGPMYSIFNLILSWWLLLTNVWGIVTKSIVFYHMTKLKLSESQDSLRNKLRRIFSKRSYHMNVMITAICLINCLLGMLVSVLIWKFEDNFPDLFIYSLIFVLRYFYSMYRYSNYFMNSDSTDPHNPYNFPEFIYSDPETPISFPKVIERNTCSICLNKYEEKCKIVEFPCKNNHYFHIECMFKWLSVSLTCPLCQSGIFPE